MVSYVLMRRPMRTEVDNSRLLQQLRPNKTDELVIHSSSRLSGDEQREQSEVQHSMWDLTRIITMAGKVLA